MATTTIHIKNMICHRCIKAVKDDLTNLGLNVSSIKLGQARFEKNPDVTLLQIKNALRENGFDIIEAANEQLVEEIKQLIIDLIQNSPQELHDINFTRYISEKIKKPYRFLSGTFSAKKKMTIEHYIILVKIEKAKELLEYGEMNLSEIANHLGYKTLQHLSNQFREITGKSAAQYQKLKSKARKGFDKI